MAINSLKWKSGAGPDKLSLFVVKMCIYALVWPIWLLYQKRFQESRIPDAFKLSRVVPVYEKGDKSDVTNYHQSCHFEDIRNRSEKQANDYH